MFSENTHTDIQEEGQKRSFRSTEAAIRTTNENWGCQNHVNDEANGQIDREEIILIYKMCIIGQIITNSIEQEKLNMSNKNPFMFQNGGYIHFLITKKCIATLSHFYSFMITRSRRENVCCFTIVQLFVCLSIKQYAWHYVWQVVEILTHCLFKQSHMRGFIFEKNSMSTYLVIN